uniref:Uncharacterized protein n=1 Tax=Leptobrachium leishanense TaxID=445787 RepID=A0A8C5QQ42_9ANUR
MRSRILQEQPSIGTLARDLILFSKEEKSDWEKYLSAIQSLAPEKSDWEKYLLAVQMSVNQKKLQQKLNDIKGWIIPPGKSSPSTEEKRQYILNFSLDNSQPRGSLGYKRVLLQLFGYTGHGKSSFINSCKYVMDESDGKFQLHAEVGKAEDKPHTMKRVPYPLTKNITIVDNRGCVCMNKNKTGAIYIQLGNFQALNTELEWKEDVNDTLKAVLESQKEDVNDTLKLHWSPQKEDVNDTLKAAIEPPKEDVTDTLKAVLEPQKEDVTDTLKDVLEPQKEDVNDTLKAALDPQKKDVNDTLKAALEPQKHDVTDTLKAVLESEMEDSSLDFIVPVFIYSTEREVTEQEQEKLKNILLEAREITGIFPVVILTHERHKNLEDVKEKFWGMGASSMFPVENYTDEDDLRTGGKHDHILQALHEILKHAEIKLKESRDPISERSKRKEILGRFVNKRSVEADGIIPGKPVAQCLIL